MTAFVDRVVLHVQAGDGGHGCGSIPRGEFKPFGGPGGGHRGGGGGGGGGGGPRGGTRHGGKGRELVRGVPDGTVVQTAEGEVLADLVGTGTSFVVAHGGRGGGGNAALANSRRRAPGFAELGEPGDRLDVVLELKS